MTTRTDPGSYAIQDPPFDTYNATKAPLRTPHGAITLTLTNPGHIAVDAGYVNADHKSPANYSGGEWFAWDGIEVAGSAHFYAEDDWAPRAGLTHLYGRGGSVTPRRAAGVLAYWGEIVRRYVAEHPHVPAHADLRHSVASLASVSQDIAKAEAALRELRATRTRAQRTVRRALAASFRTGGPPESPDSPRPYYNEPVNGYVVSLVNDRDFMSAIAQER